MAVIIIDMNTGEELERQDDCHTIEGIDGDSYEIGEQKHSYDIPQPQLQIVEHDFAKDVERDRNEERIKELENELNIKQPV